MPRSLARKLLDGRSQEVKDDALRQAIRFCSFAAAGTAPFYGARFANVSDSEVIDAMGSVQMPRSLARQLLNGRSLEVKGAALKERREKLGFAPWS